MTTLVTPSQNRRSDWMAVGAGFAVLFACTGVNYAFGILFKPMLLEFGWDRATLALAASVSLFVYAVSQPLIGSLIDRLGPRRVILPSMVLMSAGIGLIAVASTPWHITLLYGVVASVGYTGTGILPVSVLINRRFPNQKNFALGVAATGFSLGHLVFTQVAAYSGEVIGWRRTYALLAAVLILFLFIVAALLRDPPSMQPSAETAGPVRARSGLDPSMDRRAAMGTAAFWLMTATYVTCGFTDFLITTHLAPFATDLGLPQSVAANAVSMLAAANIAGILLASRAADRFGSRQALVATYFLRGCALFLLLAVGDTRQLYSFSILFGATFFTTAPLSSTFVGELFGPAHRGTIFGAANMFHHFGGAAGSYIGGLVFDFAQSYRAIFLAAALLVAGSVVTLSLPRCLRRPATDKDSF